MSPTSAVPSPAGAGWTEGRIDRLKALLAQGLSANQIALALGGTTRNAVIGKIHRLGLAGCKPPSPPGRRATTPPRAPRAWRAPLPVPPPPRPPEGSPAGPALSRRERAAPPVDAVGRFADLVALPRGACRWPIGDPKAAGFGFCGAPAARAPYCQAHRERAYRTVRAAEPRGFARAARRAA